MCLFNDESCVEDSQCAEILQWCLMDLSPKDIGVRILSFLSFVFLCVEAMAILTVLELGYNYGPKLTIFSDCKSVLPQVVS